MSNIDNYRDNVLPGMDIQQLMDALVNAFQMNQYGSHDVQIRLIRTEIAERTVF